MHRAKYVRYADNLVIWCKGITAEAYVVLQTILSKLELRLNEDKKQIRDTRQEQFEFLGFSVGLVKANRSGKYFSLVEPSDKAIKSVIQKIKHYTR